MSKTNRIDRVQLAVFCGIIAFILICISISVASNQNNSGIAIVLAIIGGSLFIATVIIGIGDNVIKTIERTKSQDNEEEK